MGGPPKSNRRASATEVWRLMSDYTMGQFGQKSRMLQQLGLTPGHLKALLTLEPGEARPMGACAQTMGCDASTATWLIDRLEERGLVERRASTTDRRVKGVVLTDAGEQMKTTLQAHYYEPPPELLQLDRATLDVLRISLQKLQAPSSGKETGAVQG